MEDVNAEVGSDPFADITIADGSTEEPEIVIEDKEDLTEQSVEEAEEIERQAAIKAERDAKAGIGRRLSKVEATLTSKIEELQMTIENLTNPKKETYEEDETEPEDDDFMTKKDFKKMLYEIEKSKNETTTKYEKTYLAHIHALGEEDDIFNEVVSLMDKERAKYNVSYSKYKDPESDAERNYYKAKAAFLSNGSNKNINVRDKKTSLPIGTASAGKMKEQETKTIALDDTARAFLKSIGKENDKEFIARAMK